MFQTPYDQNQLRTHLHKKYLVISTQIQIILEIHQVMLNTSCDVCWEDIEELDIDAEFGSEVSIICFKCQSESGGM